MVSYELMKHQNDIILSLVKEALKTRGFQDPDLNPVINGRNSLTIEDNKNDLFIKVYSKSTLMLNSLLAQQIIEIKVPTPKFLFHSGVKDREALDIETRSRLAEEVNIILENNYD